MTLPKFNAASVAIFAILAVGLILRLVNLGFGLPSLYDPDEPIFMITALKLLKDGTLNPGWFGHPGSTTIYLLAVIDIIAVAIGVGSGRFANIQQFASAAYADPALLFIPSRMGMVVIAVGCIWLTYRLARSCFDEATGLIAAGLLAVNPLHIMWSQVIRTDIQASVFMIGSMVFAVRVARFGRTRDYLLAGAFVGFAMATKWPSATVFVAIIGASAVRMIGDRSQALRELRLLGLAVVAVPVALFLASPYIFLDWPTVLANVGGEVKTGHLGHNSGGWIANFIYYVFDQIGGSMGLIGLGCAIAGMILATARHRVVAVTLVPVLVVFLLLICSQAVIWSRWVLPILPLTCIFAAVTVTAAGSRLVRIIPVFVRTARLAPALLLGALVALPAVSGAWAGANAREHDTRDQAAAWARTHIPPGSTLVVEHIALKLRGQSRKIKFPMGTAGCVDGEQLLKGNVRYDRIEKDRKGSQIVDLGNVSNDRLASCRGDYLILSYYDLYRAEAARYPAEMATYRRLIADGKTVALFIPADGVASGPTVRIVAFPQRLTADGRPVSQ